MGANRNLGDVFARGRLPSVPGDNLWVAGGWIVTFPAADFPNNPAFEVYHAAVRGPGGTFLVYQDTKFYDIGENGLINAYEPTQPMFVTKGTTIYFYWSTATGTAPQVWLYLREPEVGRI